MFLCVNGQRSYRLRVEARQHWLITEVVETQREREQHFPRMQLIDPFFFHLGDDPGVGDGEFEPGLLFGRGGKVGMTKNSMGNL